MSNNPFCNWRYDLENYELCYSMAPATNWDIDFDAAYKDILRIAKNTKPMFPIIGKKNQNRLSSCGGFGGATTVESALYRAGEPLPNLSEMAAYIWCQQLDGIKGDEGSTISGMMRLVRDTGIPEEKYWPYTGVYTTKCPTPLEQAKANAAKYKLPYFYPGITSKHIVAFLALELGGIDWGIRWYDSYKGKITKDNVMKGNLLGGHATSLTSVINKDGKIVVELINSHLNNEVIEVDEYALSKILDDKYSVAIGFSKQNSPQKKLIDFTTDSHWS